MNYCIAIYGAPYTSQACQSALHFCRALLKRGHSIQRLFFYQDGVHTASTLAVPPQDESNLPAEWQGFIESNQLDAVVCVAAALRRGLLNSEEQQRYEKPAANLSAATELSGLGQLIDGAVHCDRLVSFGA
ncbi:sulfurtransferase complex subunit TusD [Aestuariirhabdus litorea]|uniref:Sulfurtransferase complex subunit TusD n=1 Tax=Aestuariirhabdus litorea TaxID=2528527 RepID=A0A3P3VQ77_9GAMM|nr:sulfurtransferase complex subunit TusD [Aestuariirhabdus litorea]RRJ84780.1 sulfurtransferase complex subunit TusD [Aestuariirhabdus litorea]RWW98004.1 sulfurtransferase complex subunit TusD [Endozoicomonadaceae bacterium GTF-13]